MNVSPPAEDPLVKAQREQAERDSIRVQQEGLTRDTSRLMRSFGSKSLFSATPGGRSMLGGV